MSTGTFTLSEAAMRDLVKQCKAALSAVKSGTCEANVTLNVAVYDADRDLTFAQLTGTVASKKRKERPATASDRLNDAFMNAGTAIGLRTRKAMLAIFEVENLDKALQFAGKPAAGVPKNGVQPTSRAVTTLMSAVYATVHKPKRDRTESTKLVAMDAQLDQMAAALEADPVGTLAGLQYVKAMHTAVHGAPMTELEIEAARMML